LVGFGALLEGEELRHRVYRSMLGKPGVKQKSRSRSSAQLRLLSFHDHLLWGWTVEQLLLIYTMSDRWSEQERCSWVEMQGPEIAVLRFRWGRPAVDDRWAHGPFKYGSTGVRPVNDSLYHPPHHHITVDWDQAQTKSCQEYILYSVIRRLNAQIEHKRQNQQLLLFKLRPYILQ
jgi:hypothetical protein